MSRKAPTHVNRRRFLKLAAAAAGTSALPVALRLPPLIASANISAAPFVPQNSNRVILNFNTDWLYANTDVSNGQSTTLNESAFAPVNLPHANNIVKHKPVTATEFRFVSWYRRHFSLPSSDSGRRVYVEFQGIGTVADVFVNGTSVGQHKGAYTSFFFDITNQVSFGGADNVIAVRVDSSFRADIPPEGGNIDYYLFGGIVRDVKMILCDPLHVEWAFISTPNPSSSSAAVNAKTRVVNQGSAAKSCTVITNVVDAGNNLVATATSTQTIAASGSFEFDHTTNAISNPNLWHPDNPFLYTVFTQVRDGSTFVDEHKVTTGLRKVEFRPSTGFFINGQSFKLRGLDRHETFPYIGRAAPNRLQRKDADILKFDIGCNVIRCSHYVQDPDFLDRCDQIGLMVFEEMPGWEFIGNSAWQSLAIKNVEDMVIRDRNHPSILTWGIRINESNCNNSFYTQTNNKAHSLDSTRPTHGVRNSDCLTEFIEDLFTRNDFALDVTAPVALPYMITEHTGHTFPTHSWDPETTLVEHLLRHARKNNGVMARADVAGAMGWCAFDYNSSHSIAENNVCYHGVADIWRIPKHAAFFYRSQTDPAKYGPMVYIANYWKSNSPTTVDVVSNCAQVELFVNGVSRGIRSPSVHTNLPHPIFEWTGVTFQSGELRAEGRIGGSVVATHSRRTPGAATQLVLTPDDTALVADGGDMTRVVVTARDANNQVVPGASPSVSFSVTGVGTFMGENPLVLEDGKGAFFVQTRLDQTGAITCRATASGLTAGSANLTASAMTEPRVPKPTGGSATPTPTRTPTRTNTPTGPTATPTRTATPGAATNLAQGKAASADSAQAANPAASGNDGNTSTRWSAANGNTGHWWKVDLGASFNLTASEVMWEFSGRVYRYRVEVSTDNSTWTTVVDKTNNTSTAQTQNDPFTANARFVRITVTGLPTSPATWASFWEFRVFGS